MRNDLQYDLCTKCGEWHDDSDKGIWWQLNHPCAGNRITYRIMTGRAGMEIFNSLFAEHVDPFEGLLDFPHFKAMPDYETASWLEKNCYSLARDMEVKQMKRMKAYLQLEEDLMYKY